MPTPSSLSRSNRIEELVAGLQDLEQLDLALILGDTEDELFPIYRKISASDGCETAATFICDLMEGDIRIFVTNPKENKPHFTAKI